MTPQEALPAPTRVSPASATEQKHNENNDQYGFHVSTSILRGIWLTRLTSSANGIMNESNMDICPVQDTLYVVCFSVLRKLIVLVSSAGLTIDALRHAKVFRYSCRTTLRRESLIWILLVLYSMKPSFLNLFMKDQPEIALCQ
jgi:hypothetical protein